MMNTVSIVVCLSIGFWIFIVGIILAFLAGGNPIRRERERGK